MLLQLRSREFRKTKSNLSREHESTGRRVDPKYIPHFPTECIGHSSSGQTFRKRRNTLDIDFRADALWAIDGVVVVDHCARVSYVDEATSNSI